MREFLSHDRIGSFSRGAYPNSNSSCTPVEYAKTDLKSMTKN